MKPKHWNDTDYAIFDYYLSLLEIEICKYIAINFRRPNLETESELFQLQNLLQLINACRLIIHGWNTNKKYSTPIPILHLIGQHISSALGFSGYYFNDTMYPSGDIKPLADPPITVTPTSSPQHWIVTTLKPNFIVQDNVTGIHNLIYNIGLLYGLLPDINTKSNPTDLDTTSRHFLLSAIFRLMRMIATPPVKPKDLEENLRLLNLGLQHSTQKLSINPI